MPKTLNSSSFIEKLETNYNEKSNPEYLISEILPSHEVHLISGPSGAGKTSFLLKLITGPWLKGQKVFGHQSNPVPFLYVPFDRSGASLQRTLKRLNISSELLPTFPLDEQTHAWPIEKIITESLKLKPELKLFIIEGMASKITGRIVDYQTVAHFLISLTQLCKKQQVTIIGVVHNAKTKAGEKYESPREQIMGSAAFGAYSETVFSVVPVEPDSPNSARELWIMPRNAKEERYRMVFENGELLLAKNFSTEDSKLTAYQRLKAFIVSQNPGKTFSTLEASNNTELSGTSLDRAIKEAIQNGFIERTKPGSFSVTGNISQTDS